MKKERKRNKRLKKTLTFTGAIQNAGDMKGETGMKAFRKQLKVAQVIHQAVSRRGSIFEKLVTHTLARGFNERAPALHDRV
jgi:hypothetical protein